VNRLAALGRAAAAERLFIAGISPLIPDDGCDPRLKTAVLLSPDEPAFWTHFCASAEQRDGRPDALDRWSRRVIGRIACNMGAKAAFPFGGPPWRPFTRWARRSGQVHESPVGLMVHATRGLWISYRGAILLREELAAAPAPSPCATCADQPCRTACPVDAFATGSYNVPACHAWLDREPSDCRANGCLVRRACPVGQSRRDPAQSAFHMKAFHP
jgi:epoxyqueuosine reductase